MPSFIVLDLAVDGYFLPSVSVETEQHLLDFLNGVLNGSAQVGLSILDLVQVSLFVCVYLLSVRGETESASAPDA